MSSTPQTAKKKLEEPLMIADHPVLDFLNTVVMIDGEKVDFFEGDGDVEEWLQRAGFVVSPRHELRPGRLLETARVVRETVRDAVERKKAGKPFPIGPLSDLLVKSSSHLELSQHRGKGLQLKRVWQSSTAEQLLGPLVEAAAELLTTGDFDLVRPCEDQTCILWFYDRTKSHHRRWCSMSTCGNRFKVAAFRQRRRASGV